MLPPALHDLAAYQSGVFNRRQASERGLVEHDLRRLVRRREVVRLSPGVFIDHTGEPTWIQRAWAAVLAREPAALAGESALRAWDGPGRAARGTEVIHVAVDRHRRLRHTSDVRLHRVSGLDALTHPSAAPPRVRVEHAVLAVAGQALDEAAVVSVLADAVQSRRTTPARLAEALAEHPTLRRRAFVTSVLADVAEGACSALEVGYLRGVESAHGLPRAARQLRAHSRGGSIYRDVAYEAYGLVVELDGRLFHDSARARHRDLVRDLDAAVAGLRTVRIGWGQVFGDACHTAEQVGELLRRGGWPERLRACDVCR